MITSYRHSWMRNRSVFTIEHEMIPSPLHCSIQCLIECPSSLNPSQSTHFLSGQDLLVASAQTRKSQSIAKDQSRDVRHVFRSSSSPDEEQVCFFSRIRLMYPIYNLMNNIFHLQVGIRMNLQIHFYIFMLVSFRCLSPHLHLCFCQYLCPCPFLL